MDNALIELIRTAHQDALRVEESTARIAFATARAARAAPAAGAVDATRAAEAARAADVAAQAAQAALAILRCCCPLTYTGD